MYSLGVVLYEMVTGKAAFLGRQPGLHRLQARQGGGPRSPSLNPSIPADFDAIVMKAMAKDPEDRYQSADELRADLVRFSQGQPVMAAVEPTRVAAAVVAPAPAPRSGARPASRAWPGRLPCRRPTGAGRGRRPPSGRRERVGSAALLIGLLVVLAVLLFFVGRSLGWWDSTKTLTVPTDVVGKPVSAATAELHQRRLHAT